MPLPSKESLLATADEAEARAAAREREAASLRDFAAELRKAAEKAPRGLPVVDTDDTLPGMNVDTRGKSEAVTRAVGRATRNHPAQRAFYKAGKTVGQIAEELREGRPRVSSWMSEDEPRPIPRHHADYLREHYKVPLSAWKNLGK